MQKHHFKRHAFVVVRGLLLVITATFLQYGEYFGRLEGLLYDERVRHCQAFRPPPTPTLVQLDVDENALNYIGRWPWDPSRMARVINEIAITKPKIMAMDILFLEAKGTVYGKNDPVGVDEDADLAGAISRLGCAVIPVSVKFDSVGPQSKLRQRILPMLIDNPELTWEECQTNLRAKGITDTSENDSTDSYLQIREQAFYERIWREVHARNDADPDKEQIKKAMLPHADPRVSGTVLGNLFETQLAKVLREKALLRFTLPVPPGVPLVRVNEVFSPILPIGLAAAHSGFVDFVPETTEGTIRSVPLLVQYLDRMIPQMDLVTACAVLGGDIQKIRVTATSITLPIPGKPDVVIPVSVKDSRVLGAVGTLMEIPLFGQRNDWLTMYDFPRYKTQAHHVSVYEVWEICETIDKKKTNEQKLFPFLLQALQVMYVDTKPYEAAPPTGDALDALVKDTLKKLPEFLTNQAADPDADADTKRAIAAGKEDLTFLRKFDEENTKLNQQVIDLRAKLAADLHDKTIFFGGTATGLLDLQPTSLFIQCPGVVIHGAIYNAIITGKMWRITPPWLGIVLTAVMGLLTLAIVFGFSPSIAFAGSLFVALGYLAIDGYYLFAHENLIVTAAGPAVAVALVWSGMTLTSFLTEIAERSRITKRFQGYVDPRLVDIMVSNPDHAGFDGEKREVTCCFSDLAGFTTLTDQMGERIVPLLSEYMSEMIPVIRKNEGYVSQMAGDGIYFFFGAPIDFAGHAEFAMNAAFGMYKALDAFNLILKDRGLSQLGMRVGIATGEAIVGDTGSSDSHSYTAMGATVNLASRLESANKVFGSRMLVIARTVELLNGKYLVRPLANLRVAGKLNCEVVYEPLCLMADATDHDRKLVEHTAKVFEAFREGNFNRCLAACVEMEDAFGPGKFTNLYAKQCHQHMADGLVPENFEGQILLTEK